MKPTPLALLQGGSVGDTQVVTKDGQRLCLRYKQPNDIHWCHCDFNISQKAAKSMAKLISQLCGELQLAVCLSRGDGAIERRPKHLWTSDKPQKQATAKAAWELSASISG